MKDRMTNERQDTVKERPQWTQLLMVFGLTAIGYAFDQITKLWVLNNMTEGQVIPVWPPLLNWHFVRNPGAAFSMGEEYTWVFTIIMVLVASYILFKLRTTTRTSWLIVLGVLLGGILGNLTDRLIQEPGFGVGHVIDFVALPNFAIFNVADSLIVCSMIVIALMLIRGVPMNEQEALEREEERRNKEVSTEQSSEQ